MEKECSNNNLGEKGSSPINIFSDDASKFKIIENDEFTRFIKEKRKAYNDHYGKELSTRDLGNILGIDYEMFRKILNQSKRTKKRDCIIAIGVALHMNVKDIDKALRLYHYMPPLDTKNRDGFIRWLIEGSEKDSWSEITINKLNRNLELKGFPVLDIHDKRKTTDNDTSICNYKIIKTIINTPIDADNYYADRYNSLSTKYSPFNCTCNGEMYLSKLNEDKDFKLIVDSFGKLSSKNYSKDGKKCNYVKYNDLDKTGEFIEYYELLINSINAEKHRLLGLLNDTKNYSTRTSARVIEDSICVFSEEYNYSVPELNEYFVLSLSNSKYTLRVYDRSCFMQYYLSPDEYKKFYNNTFVTAKETYNSIDEIDFLIEAEDNNTSERSKLRLRKRAFLRLKPFVDELHQQIVDRQAFILNPEFCIENPYEVLSHFNVEVDFECKYDENYGEICESLTEKEYVLPDGGKIIITLDDLFEGFELGLSKIEDICRIKKKFGKISKIS